VLIRPIAQVLAVLVVIGGMTGLSAQVPAAQLMLSWVDHATDEEGYLVERRASATPTFTQVAYLGPNTAGYLDASVASGGTYCYRVRAFNVAGISAYSSEVCGTAAGAATLPLSVTLNQSTFRASDTLVATVHAVEGIVTAPIDAYVVVQAGGAIFSLQLDGRLVPGLVPLARGVMVPTGSAQFGFPLAGAPPGAYTWIAGVTSPGTLSLMAPLSTTPFTIIP
jgi:hypothetical protein